MMYLSTESKNFSFWHALGNIGKIIAVTLPISIITGTITAFVYLTDINSRALFSEILSNINALTAISISSFIIIVFFFISISYYPYTLIFFISDFFNHDLRIKFRGKIRNGRKSYYLVIAITSIVMLIPFFLAVIYKLNPLGYFVVHSTVYSIPILYLFLSNEGTQYSSRQNWLNHCIFLLIFLLSNWAYCLVSLMSLSMGQKLISNPTSALLVFMVIILFSYFFASGLIGFGKLGKNKNMTKPMLYFMPFVINTFFIVLFILQDPTPKLKILQILGYVEHNSSARWYLVDYQPLQNARKHETKTQPEDFETWLKTFQPIPPYIYTRKYNNPNILYGYLAWNLGDTKILCPQSVPLDETVAKKCLYIKKEHIRPLPDIY